MIMSWLKNKASKTSIMWTKYCTYTQLVQKNKTKNIFPTEVQALLYISYYMCIQ